MATPTRQEIEDLAKELYAKDQYRKGCPELAEISPETDELKEDGYYSEAMSQLMSSEQNRYAEFLTEQKEKAKDLLEIESLQIDIPELLANGLFVTGTRQCGKTTIVKEIVRRLIKENINCFIVDPSLAWANFLPSITIEPQGTHAYNWRDESVVFDTSKLHSDLQQKFSEIFCKAVLDAAIARGKNQPRTVLVFEECHTILPNFALNGDKFRETKRLITQGGNWNVSFVAISQFSSMIDKLLIKCAQQRFFGQSTEPNDLKYLKNFLGDRVNELETLARGEFLYSHSGKIAKVHTSIQKAYTEPCPVIEVER